MTQSTFLSICYNNTVNPSIALENKELRTMLRILKNNKNLFTREEEIKEIEIIFSEQF